MSNASENTNGRGGNVFVQTNEAGGNRVIAFGAREAAAT